MAITAYKSKQTETMVNNNLTEITKRVWLPVNQNPVDPQFLPKEVPYTDDKKTIEQVAIAISKSMPVLLIGETGTGKTSMIRHIAFKTNNAFVRVNHNGGTTPEDILGRWTIVDGETVWVDGLLTEAMKKGWYYLADEINAAGAEINFVYHSVLDDDARLVLVEKGNEVVIPHENFRFFAGMNPPTEYAGTKELNKALMSRFIVVKTDFPAPDIESSILMERTGIPQDVAEMMVKTAGEIRVAHIKGDIAYVFSTRDLIMWAEMFKVYKKYMLAAEMTILNKIGADDFESVRDTMGMNLNQLDSATTTKKKTSSPEEAPEF